MENEKIEDKSEEMRSQIYLSRIVRSCRNAGFVEGEKSLNIEEISAALEEVLEEEKDYEKEVKSNGYEFLKSILNNSSIPIKIMLGRLDKAVEKTEEMLENLRVSPATTTNHRIKMQNNAEDDKKVQDRLDSYHNRWIKNFSSNDPDPIEPLVKEKHPVSVSQVLHHNKINELVKLVNWLRKQHEL